MTRTLPAARRTVDLSGLVAVVTGAGSGLGAAIARVLGEAGMTVVAADVRREPVEEVAARLRGDGLAVEAVELDVRDADRSAEALDAVEDRHGAIEVLVNNAGVDETLPVEEMSFEAWDRIIGVNLRGPFVLSRHVLPGMKARGRGHVVNIVSTAAKRAWPNASAYHASKWGLLGFSHALHTEARPHGVKVTAIVAGGMRTPFLLDRFPDIDLGTLQDPGVVAETLRFVLEGPPESVVPEILVLPMGETSWP